MHRGDLRATVPALYSLQLTTAKHRVLQGLDYQAHHGAKEHLDVLEDDAHKNIETAQATPQKLLEGRSHARPFFPFP